MKNKLIYLISVLFVAVACFSCSDDDDDNNDKDLIGTWNYTKKTSDIHFKFEYNGDEISFPEGLIRLSQKEYRELAKQGLMLP